LKKNLQKISPKLVQKLPRITKNNELVANKWLSEYGFDINKITKIITDK
jgi:hypothetical protein